MSTCGGRLPKTSRCVFWRIAKERFGLAARNLACIASRRARFECSPKSNLVNCIVEDDFGDLWIGHDRGVYRVAKSALEAVADRRATTAECVNFDESDGLLSREINGQVSTPTACKTPDGRLWFCTQGGLAVVDPRAVRGTDPPPLVVIEQVFADDEPIHINGTAETPISAAADARERQSNSGSKAQRAALSLQEGSLLVPAPTRLAPGRARTMEFQFTANSFNFPARVRFAYRLEGYETNWHHVGTRRMAHYTNLDPGEYSFRVRAANHHGVWSEPGAVFAFVLAPYYWQTWAFKLGAGLFAGLAVFSTGRWQIRKLRKLHRLEREQDNVERVAAVSRERQGIARDIHDELATALAHIAQLSPDYQIKALANETIGKISELNWAHNPRFDALANLVPYLREYAARFITDTRLEPRLYFPADVPERQIPGLIRRHLLSVLNEALHSVLKHAEARCVEVQLSLLDSRLTLSIVDDGKGVSLANGSHPGNGLANMRGRVQELGGILAIHSIPGNGTRLEISIPLPRDVKPIL